MLRRKPLACNSVMIVAGVGVLGPRLIVEAQQDVLLGHVLGGWFLETAEHLGELLVVASSE